MKKDEVIGLLKEQIKELRDDNNRPLDQIDDLIKEVSSLKEALLQKGESLGKQQRLTKGIAKLVSNTSEQQQPPQSSRILHRSICRHIASSHYDMLYTT